MVGNKDLPPSPEAVDRLDPPLYVPSEMSREPIVLGNHISRVMYVRNLSDMQLAERIGVSRAQINRIRNGRATPRVATALAIASALDCRVREIFFLKIRTTR